MHDQTGHACCVRNHTSREILYHSVNSFFYICTEKINETPDEYRSIPLFIYKFLYLFRLPDQCRCGAMIDRGRSAKTPDNVIIGLGPVNRQLPVFGITMAIRGRITQCAPTAIPIGNDIRPVIDRITAGSYPRYGGWLCAGWAGMHATATASAQHPVNGAMPPVITFCRIRGLGTAVEIRNCGGLRRLCRSSLCTLNGQNWQGRRHHRRTSRPGDHAATGNSLRHFPCQLFTQPIKKRFSHDQYFPNQGEQYELTEKILTAA